MPPIDRASAGNGLARRSLATRTEAETAQAARVDLSAIVRGGDESYTPPSRPAGFVAYGLTALLGREQVWGRVDCAARAHGSKTVQIPGVRWMSDAAIREVQIGRASC